MPGLWRGRLHLVVALAGLLTAGLATSACTEDDCADFRPASPTALQGDEQSVEIQISERGHAADIDLGDAYWSTDDTLPSNVPEADIESAVAVMRDSGHVDVSVGDHTLEFAGPLGCY